MKRQNLKKSKKTDNTILRDRFISFMYSKCRNHGSESLSTKSMRWSDHYRISPKHYFHFSPLSIIQNIYKIILPIHINMQSVSTSSPFNFRSRAQYYVTLARQVYPFISAFICSSVFPVLFPFPCPILR